MSGNLTIKGRLLALLAGTLLTVFALELFLHLYNPALSRVSHNRIILPQHKRYEFRNLDFRGLSKTIIHTKNSLGFRGPEPPEDFSNHLKIVAIGGSTTESLYQTDNKAWPLVLSNLLSNNFSRVWVNNAGLEGHTTFGHRILLNDYVGNLQPDIALFLVGANDVGKSNPSDHDAEHVKNGIYLQSLEGFLKSLSNYTEIVATLLDIYRHLRARQLGIVHTNLDLTRLGHKNPSNLTSEEILRTHRNSYASEYEGRLNEMITIARKYNIDPVIITQPLLLGEGIDDVTNVNLQTVSVNLHHKSISGYLAWQILEIYNDVSRKVARKHGILLIDLARKLPKSSRYFYDYVHYTDAGALMVGKVVYEALCPYLERAYEAFLTRSCKNYPSKGV